MEFKIELYRTFLKSIKNSSYKIFNVRDYVKKQDIISKNIKLIILRHDVDRKINNALNIATIEYSMGISSTYYFRYNSEPNWDIIRKIYELGHEIGYHYEILSQANGDMKRAKILFESNLNEFRKRVPVETVSMHGAPLSKHNNLDFWNGNSLEDYNLLAEPYLSFDYSNIRYITDSGRNWTTGKNNIRDKVAQKVEKSREISTTSELIELIKHEKEERILINIHPHYWEDKLLNWSFQYFVDLMTTLIKNIIKLIRK